VLNDAEKKLILNSWRLVVPIKNTAIGIPGARSSAS
jgi:hypothetical protein